MAFPSQDADSLPETMQSLHLSDSTPQLEEPSQAPNSLAEPPRLSHRSVSTSATTAGMTASSTPLGALNAARRPIPQSTLSSRGGGLTGDLAAKMRAFAQTRQGAPPPNRLQPGTPGPQQGSPSDAAPSGAAGGGFGRSGLLTPGGLVVGGAPRNYPIPSHVGRPGVQSTQSTPAMPNLLMPGNKNSLAAKRGMNLGGLPGAPPGRAPPPGGKKKPGLTLSQMNNNIGPEPSNSTSATPASEPNKGASAMDKYAEYIDTAAGSLKFKGKATIHGKGVDFSNGTSFNISLDEVDTLDELGKGNYGTVYKVRHSRPQIRKPGQGLAGNKAHPSVAVPLSPTTKTAGDKDASPTTIRGGTTGIVMAMKEIRLELDDAKFAAIIMELDILHRCISPFIVDFYGAFFQEGAVYICLEFMDGGSIDKLYGDGIPENILRKITLSTTMGLKSLKDEHNIIHRDVKPTNILMNTAGQIKICDFGVSGNLVASIAKTNIGCQSYMAPERISGGGIAQAGANPGGGTYSVQSDIWSLGLTIIECALGRYPYPPETYDNIFSQLSAIVDGDPPDLPADTFSDAAHDFVHGCLNKIPKLRPTYAMLLQHPWLAPLLKPPTITEEDEETGESSMESLEAGTPTTADKEVAEWVKAAIERRRNGTMGKSAKPALHAAPLDAVASPTLEKGKLEPVAV
ncbi:MAP kinase kinase Wis1 [Cryomyces antarcticus]|uniref:mitogen-activated protein kinase kinase n=1 Tax=Cryomyces antarcticus TaxID=329879 RepID=A0ABR0M9I6_9PEZI|nr:MAP kinase kinase Wis1 [Cryomyces antarcticus]